MTRWIAFDRQSAAAVFASARITAELHDAGDALGAALASDKDNVVLMPSREPARALVAQIRRAPVAADDQRPPVAYEAAGFLGLIDEPVYDEEPAKPKKWWRKILD